ncbi:hypothetical protein [Roseateles asaccharophilus]|uniref:Tetratricopeptide repeat protein n=1 Tax=Roseateles asaccharophilus TaxID=582607 RepID=A0ABU2A6S5_9BURK|nr:hypothetical protein [Roseateles asaccharophilus]MDR7332895.1 hypothetical protein [Roseateles asaccharophilus]
MKSAQALLLACATATAAHAAPPFTPRLDGEVVERLPLRAGAADERARRRAEQRQLLQQPRDADLALRHAREALERGRRSGDARELGNAQAWLQPWWTDAAAPPAVRLMKATVLQARHEFDAALVELERLPPPAQLPPAVAAQAGLTRATLLQLRGRWADARHQCEQLAAPPLALAHGEACLAELDSLQGRQAESALRFAALGRRRDAPQAWLALLRAEAAERQGHAAAGTLYARALQLNDDIYTRAATADWLLAAGRPAEVTAIVRAGQPDDLPDALLLRAAIAAQRMKAPGAASMAQQLQTRFVAAAARGDDAAHARERARFALDVQGDAALALQQATLNWQQQREPADAVLLLRAARAAGRPDAAAPVQAFVRDQRLHDRRLQEQP